MAISWSTMPGRGRRGALVAGVRVLALGVVLAGPSLAPAAASPTGAATPTCNGIPATISQPNRHSKRRGHGPTFVGTSGDDVIVGTAKADRIAGGGGNDTICGGGGNDRLNGGSGNDSLAGGDGRDTLNGGDGDDLLRGEGGIDACFGGPGAGDSVDLISFCEKEVGIEIQGT